jgi:hypothetical protein
MIGRLPHLFYFLLRKEAAQQTLFHSDEAKSTGSDRLRE